MSIWNYFIPVMWEKFISNSSTKLYEKIILHYQMYLEKCHGTPSTMDNNNSPSFPISLSVELPSLPCLMRWDRRSLSIDWNSAKIRHTVRGVDILP